MTLVASILRMDTGTTGNITGVCHTFARHKACRIAYICQRLYQVHCCTLVIMHVCPRFDVRITCIPVLVGTLAYTLVVAPVHASSHSLLVRLIAVCTSSRRCMLNHSALSYVTYIYVRIVIANLEYTWFCFNMLVTRFDDTCLVIARRNTRCSCSVCPLLVLRSARCPS